MKEQLEDLNFRIQFLVQLETGTQIDLVDHWIKAERSPKHWQCYKFAKIFIILLDMMNHKKTISVVNIFNKSDTKQKKSIGQIIA